MDLEMFLVSRCREIGCAPVSTPLVWLSVSPWGGLTCLTSVGQGRKDARCQIGVNIMWNWAYSCEPVLNGRNSRRPLWLEISYYKLVQCTKQQLLVCYNNSLVLHKIYINFVINTKMSCYVSEERKKSVWGLTASRRHGHVRASP